MQSIDVVVVGAGPVGLLTAIELTLGGAHVLVLERLSAPSPVLKAGGMGPLGLEALQRRGMGPAIAAAQAEALSAMVIRSDTAAQGGGPRFSGHFGGLALIRADVQKEPNRRGALVGQQAIEAILGDRVRALGIEVRRDCDVKALEANDHGVDLTCTSASGEQTIRCAYLVGCDGGRSPVRKLAGFDLPGFDPTLTMYQGVVEIDYPERLSLSRFCYTSGGMYMSFLGRLAMIDFSGPPADRHAPITHEEIEAVLRRVSGADVRIKSFENASRWTDNTRLVDTYRKGRIMLAGDSAHIHSPFGGQGMSLGLVDAANLGWKLAAVIRDDAPDSLLDTYTAERRPVAEAVLANTLAQLAIMRPDPQASAMRDLMARLMSLDDVNQLIGDMMSGLSARYDLGSTDDEVGKLAGDRVINPDAGLSLYDLMQEGSGVLLESSKARGSDLVSAGEHRVRCVQIEEGPSRLFRPDACLAWTGEAGTTDGLADALRRWFPRDQTNAQNPI